VGVILGYPGERADPLEREEASVTDVLSMAEDVTKLPTSSSVQSSPRQPPTVSDTTAAAFPRSTVDSRGPRKEPIIKGARILHHGRGIMLGHARLRLIFARWQKLPVSLLQQLVDTIDIE